MSATDEIRELSGQLGLHLSVDGSRPLSDLTASLGTLVRRAADRRPPQVVVLRIDRRSTWDRGWPGDVRVQDVNRWERAVRGLERLAAATIAVVGGTCGGPALDLVLATDYRIATDDLRLLLPVNDDHVWPGMAVHRLVSQIGLARARQLVLWGTDVTAAQALELGVVNEVVTDADAALAMAAVWLGRPAGAELAVRRQLLLDATVTSYDDALGSHLAACDRELRRGRGER